MNYKQGEYEPVNKDKYVGTRNPRYLSSWELEVFKRFDRNPHVIEWGAETVVVPYYSTVDGRKRRYLVDLYVKYQDSKGNIKKELIEIKPYKQTIPPKKVGRKSKKAFLNDQYTYAVNMDKWRAASEFAKQRGMTFRILTENELFK